jgi:mediator of RNA polymerase II transcription subunit 22
MATPFQTDASRPSALPSANIGARNYDQHPAESSEEYLDIVEEEWNKKVDAEVDTLVDGMVDLVAIASVRRLCLRMMDIRMRCFASRAGRR